MHHHHRAGLLQHLQAHIDAHIEARYLDPALTPRAAARDLGVSLRQLHAALATTPRSFSQRVTQRRLQRAWALLATGSANVADVAFASGFGSLATFYRQYTAAFGATPAGREVPVLPPAGGRKRGAAAGPARVEKTALGGPPTMSSPTRHPTQESR